MATENDYQIDPAIEKIVMALCDDRSKLVRVYYYRDYENHFVQTYGMAKGTQRYRDVNYPIGDIAIFARADVEAKTDHALVAALEYTGDSTDPYAIAEWVYAKMNSLTENPLSAAFGYDPMTDFEALSDEEVAKATAHNRAATKGQGVGHTSMSIGDVVEINNNFYVVASFGFKQLE